MPRTYPPRRTLVAIRLDPAVLDEIDAQAAAASLDRSAMMRALIAEALTARQSRCECGDDYDYEGNRFVDTTLCPLHHQRR